MLDVKVTLVDIANRVLDIYNTNERCEKYEVRIC